MAGPVPELVKVSLHQRVPLKLQQPTVEEHNKARPVVSEAKHDGYSVNAKPLQSSDGPRASSCVRSA